MKKNLFLSIFSVSLEYSDGFGSQRDTWPLYSVHWAESRADTSPTLKGHSKWRWRKSYGHEFVCLRHPWVMWFSFHAHRFMHMQHLSHKKRFPWFKASEKGSSRVVHAATCLFRLPRPKEPVFIQWCMVKLQGAPLPRHEYDQSRLSETIFPLVVQWRSSSIICYFPFELVYTIRLKIRIKTT